MVALSDCFPSSFCLLLRRYWNLVTNNNNVHKKETKIWLPFKTCCSLSVPRHCYISQRKLKLLMSVYKWNSCIMVQSSQLSISQVKQKRSNQFASRLFHSLSLTMTVVMPIVLDKHYPNKTSYHIINKSHLELYSTQLPVNLSMTLLLLLYNS